MPQFDFFIWFSLSLGTIIIFQFLYYFILYYILAPFADLQKTLIKLYLLKQAQFETISIFEQATALYFQKIKFKKISTAETLNVTSDIIPALTLKKKISLQKTLTSKNLIKKEKFIFKISKTSKLKKRVSSLILSARAPSKTLPAKTPATKKSKKGALGKKS